MTELALSVVLMAVFLYALFLVVRVAVRQGVQQALRPDLLEPRSLAALHGRSVPPPQD